MVAKGSIWYLVAKVEGEVRVYRVSRIREASLLEESAVYPQGFDLAAQWQRSADEFREKLPRYYATFLAQPAVMRWVRYRGWRLVEEAPEEAGIRLRVRFDLEEEAVQFALSFGGNITVIEPSALRERVLAEAQAILENAGGVPA